MSTFQETLNDLKEKGYTQNFQFENDCINCKEIDVCLEKEEFTIDAVYYFPGNPYYFDESIIYAISSTDGTIKGILTNPFDVYGVSVSYELSIKFKRCKT